MHRAPKKEKRKIDLKISTSAFQYITIPNLVNFLKSIRKQERWVFCQEERCGWDIFKNAFLNFRLLVVPVWSYTIILITTVSALQ